MLDPQTYRASEQLAKSLIPSWRISRVHNVDLFERVGFPVRISSIRELGQIIDTMQENRFDLFMAELSGLSENEYQMVLRACDDAVKFQLTFLPHRPPVLPISTLLSAYAIYKKILGAKADFKSVLEIGPGCGYVSFFLRHHAALEDYSQIEACESFYILQNLVNLYSFGAKCDERALPPENVPAVDYFVNSRVDMELSPGVDARALAPKCFHYPWWRIGEIVNRNKSYDIVTSNANLLEFSAIALDDYLSLIQRALKPDGIFLVQCTGFEAGGTVPQLLHKLYANRLAPLMFVQAGAPTTFPAEGGTWFKARPGAQTKFTTNNGVFVKEGHPLFQRYYDQKNYKFEFIAPEPIVRAMFFERPDSGRTYSIEDFVKATEAGLGRSTRG